MLNKRTMTEKIKNCRSSKQIDTMQREVSYAFDIRNEVATISAELPMRAGDVIHKPLKKVNLVTGNGHMSLRIRGI